MTETSEQRARQIARHSWSYQERDSDSMRLFVGTGASLDEAVSMAVGRAFVEGWNASAGWLGQPDPQHARRVQVEAQREEWLVTLFVSETAAVAP